MTVHCVLGQCTVYCDNTLCIMWDENAACLGREQAAAARRRQNGITKTSSAFGWHRMDSREGSSVYKVYCRFSLDHQERGMLAILSNRIPSYPEAEIDGSLF